MTNAQVVWALGALALIVSGAPRTLMKVALFGALSPNTYEPSSALEAIVSVRGFTVRPVLESVCAPELRPVPCGYLSSSGGVWAAAANGAFGLPSLRVVAVVAIDSDEDDV